MRIYDPMLGRFLSEDPLTRNYPFYTPYSFAGNKPIAFIDLDGLEEAQPKGAIITGGWGGQLTVRTASDQEIKEYTSGMGMSGVVGAAILTDIFITKGRLTTTLLMSQGLGLTEHNRAKTPEGRAAQGARIKENATNLVISVGIGIGLSKIAGPILTFFKGPAKEEVKFLFRGTSEGFEGSNGNQKLQVTPTSSDPAVATIFAINAKNHGKGILQIALPENLQGVNYTGNVLQSMEIEIGVGLAPVEFSKKVSVTITAEQAQGILKDMGIEIPSNIRLGEVSKIIENTPRMTQSQINEFYIKAKTAASP